ncbi:hypothetical protein [Mycobacterium florentinum]|uniref:hypothetical protein n=1 Tax=Mycobacterium florentinum TaxID=292462 RepID=UPI00111C584E|nr:hypothetical protein [Mycobacterium florentinum]MCV7412597.1 hypothetical protein [Mycobacterium florentinum]BBX81981.1 hypothetical protein MFLOJ_57680 [Mycobacterium florentinum]
MDTSVQKVAAWCGLAFAAVFCCGFAIAGFIPPPAPGLSAREVAALYAEHHMRIRFGLLIATLGSAVLAVWVAVIGVQMRRIEGRQSVLAFAQMVAGACLILEFLFPLLVWQTAAYRNDRDPAIVQTLNDLGWLPFLGIACTAVLQGVVIGVLILRDKRQDPLFPRWGGYFNIWVVLMFAPASCVVLFHDGPLAWNGLISWWLALVTFFAWMLGLTWMLLRAINRQERDELTTTVASAVLAEGVTG